LERKALDLTPAGKREVGDPAGAAQVGFFTRVKITFLSVESKCPKRKSTVKFGFKQQQSMRKQPLKKR
jgi:hypothetical protein